MEVISFAGLNVNRISLSQLLLNRKILLGYALFAVALFGLWDIYHLRYFSPVINAHDAGLTPTDPALIEAMRSAVFGHVGEIDRDAPWTLLISNYMYMLYTGSGIIFLVALAELLQVRLIARAAASFMVLGLSMVFAGLFTIMTDLHVLNIQWLLLSPNTRAAIWMMMPLYLFYIPFVLFEIYLLMTHNRTLARKVALPVLLLSIAVDLIEYYIQASLFAMNTARELWTGFPGLTFYFIVSAFAAALAIMGLLSYLVHKTTSGFVPLMTMIRKALIVTLSLLFVFDLLAYLTLPAAWQQGLLSGPLGWLVFAGYLPLTFIFPLILLSQAYKPVRILIAALSVATGGYIGRILFVYGGNVVPMSDRFGTGNEVTEIYGIAETFAYSFPHTGEVLIAIGSVGIVVIVYQLFDALFSISTLKEHP